MELNLELLAVDFAERGAQAHLHASALARKLRFVDIPDPDMPLTPERLYLAEPDRLDVDAIQEATFAPCFILTGRPSEETLATKANMLWFEPEIELAKLITMTAERFDYYNTWERKLLESANRGDGIRMFGELSEPVLNRPLFMWDSLYQTIFAVWNESHYDLPEGYLKHDDMTPWPISEVNAIDDRLIKSRERKDVFTLPPVFGYESLCKNIFLDGDYVATISVDEVGGPFTERDRVLLDTLARHLLDNLRFNPLVMKSTTYTMRQHLEQMLNLHNVDTEAVTDELARMGWKSTDTCFCAVLAPENPLYTDARLSVGGDAIARRIGNTLFTVFDHTVVMVVNQSLTSRILTDEQKVRHATVERIVDEVVNEHMAMSVGASHSFHGFFELTYYYRQARWAIGAGSSADPNAHVFFFDDYLVGHIASAALEGTVPLALCPDGLVRLRFYDHQNGSDLVKVLRAYLDNGMSSTKTAQALFMHRNTLINRLKQIDSIGQMDLNDPDTQLAIRFGLRVLGN